MKLAGKRPALFLDRDGVIIVEKNFQIDIKAIEFYPGAVDALRSVDRLFLKIVVSNQSGVARKKFAENDVKRFNHALSEKLKGEGITIDGWYFCPHGPDDNCPCRKPRPGMLLEAAHKLSVEMTKSWMIGDKTSDILAGKSAGAKTILVKTGYAGKEPKAVSVKPDHVADNLYDAVEFINGSLN
jgi:D-glycero-D-manno-heptose 1,7-bisphosphate phosphatase